MVAEFVLEQSLQTLQAEKPCYWLEGKAQGYQCGGTRKDISRK